MLATRYPTTRYSLPTTMTAAEALALLDAAITIYTRASAIVADKVKTGEITAAEQAARLAQIDDLKRQIGL
jgi:polyhydroxyalkanoate synthesis regulator phasin